MHNSDLKSLVAEAVTSRPRKLGLASPFEQMFVKQFQKMLGSTLKAEVEITFVHRDAEGKLTLGIIPVELAESSKSIGMAQTVLEVMQTSYGLAAQVTLVGVPNDGIFLLYDFEQACKIADSIAAIDFSSVQFVYNACLTLGESSTKKLPTPRLVELLCQYSDKSIDAGEWRTSAVCLDYAERLLTDKLTLFRDEDQHVLKGLICLVGEAFCYANLPERAINLALNACSPAQLTGLSEDGLKTFQDYMRETLKVWQEASDIVWRVNSPIFEIGEALVKKQAA